MFLNQTELHELNHKPIIWQWNNLSEHTWNVGAFHRAIEGVVFFLSQSGSESLSLLGRL